MGVKLTNWNSKRVVKATKDETLKRMHRAVILVRDECKRSLNVSNSDRDNPSSEGEPPHRVSGDLQRSITEQVVDSGSSVEGYVGTNIVYAPRLEKGFHGTDKAGRSISQGPRPFLRPAFYNNRARITRILKGRD